MSIRNYRFFAIFESLRKYSVFLRTLNEIQKQKDVASYVRQARHNLKEGDWVRIYFCQTRRLASLYIGAQLPGGSFSTRFKVERLFREFGICVSARWGSVPLSVRENTI